MVKRKTCAALHRRARNSTLITATCQPSSTALYNISLPRTTHRISRCRHHRFQTSSPPEESLDCALVEGEDVAEEVLAYQTLNPAMILQYSQRTQTQRSHGLVPSLSDIWRTPLPLPLSMGRVHGGCLSSIEVCITLDDIQILLMKAGYRNIHSHNSS